VTIVTVIWCFIITQTSQKQQTRNCSKNNARKPLHSNKNSLLLHPLWKRNTLQRSKHKFKKRLTK